ncbi:MAG: hypothetical protein JWP35_295 [Caulobacter sp.]|nr:hypothetical protein [Caulobacter sp.]
MFVKGGGASASPPFFFGLSGGRLGIVVRGKDSTTKDTKDAKVSG